MGEVRDYLILISIFKPNKEHADFPKHLKKICITHDPAFIWFDPQSVGLGLRSEKSAREIYNHLIKGPIAGTKDLMVVELGSGWCARDDSKAYHWLTTHLGQLKP